MSCWHVSHSLAPSPVRTVSHSLHSHDPPPSLPSLSDPDGIARYPLGWHRGVWSSLRLSTLIKFDSRFKKTRHNSQLLLCNFPRCTLYNLTKNYLFNLFNTTTTRNLQHIFARFLNDSSSVFYHNLLCLPEWNICKISEERQWRNVWGALPPIQGPKALPMAKAMAMVLAIQICALWSQREVSRFPLSVVQKEEHEQR